MKKFIIFSLIFHIGVAVVLFFSSNHRFKADITGALSHFRNSVSADLMEIPRKKVKKPRVRKKVAQKRVTQKKTKVVRKKQKSKEVVIAPKKIELKEALKKDIPKVEEKKSVAEKELKTQNEIQEVLEEKNLKDTSSKNLVVSEEEPNPIYENFSFEESVGEKPVDEVVILPEVEELKKTLKEEVDQPVVLLNKEKLKEEVVEEVLKEIVLQEDLMGPQEVKIAEEIEKKEEPIVLEEMIEKEIASQEDSITPQEVKTAEEGSKEKQMISQEKEPEVFEEIKKVEQASQEDLMGPQEVKTAEEIEKKEEPVVLEEMIEKEIAPQEVKIAEEIEKKEEPVFEEIKKVEQVSQEDLMGPQEVKIAEEIEKKEEPIISENKLPEESKYLSHLKGLNIKEIKDEKLDPTFIYPEQARQAGKEGSVMVAYFVKSDGSVEKVHLFQSSGHPSLDDEALKVLAQQSYSSISSGWYKRRVDFKLKNM